MKEWKITEAGKVPKLKKPVLIVGMPGIGNVGKVAVDFLIEELKAKKMLDFSSHSFPHSVFVNDQNLIELPKIEMYFKKFNNGKHDLIFLAGDIQPIDEESCYSFTEKVLEIVTRMNVYEIITLGGIGLQSVPKKPKLYCTGNNKEIIKKYKKGTKMNDKIYGIVGPIVGVAGLALGLSEKQGIPAVCILAETFGHPMYLGVKGSREILKVLAQKLSLKINIKDLDKEIETLEQEILKKTEEMTGVSKKSARKKLESLSEEISYIG
jgi:uncharacterized protein (TIGR00162 family)